MLGCIPCTDFTRYPLITGQAAILAKKICLYRQYTLTDTQILFQNDVYTSPVNLKRPSVAKFIITDWGIYIVDSGIWLSYRPTSLCSLAGRYDNPMPEKALSPQSGTMNLDTDFTA
jgi:hypothetical protein